MSQGFTEKAWHPSTDRELVLREATISTSNPMHMMKALMRGMNWVSKEDIAPVQNKRFLIISGINDGLTPADSGQQLAKWLEEKNSVSFEIVENAAHMLTLEQPQIINSLITTFQSLILL